MYNVENMMIVKKVFFSQISIPDEYKEDLPE